MYVKGPVVGTLVHDNYMCELQLRNSLPKSVAFNFRLFLYASDF